VDYPIGRAESKFSRWQVGIEEVKSTKPVAEETGYQSAM